MSPLNLLRISALLGALAVALGAVGAHALREMLLQNQHLETYELAVRYHFYHVLALAFTALLQAAYPHARLQAAAWAFLSGIMLFSGSLYALSLTGVRLFAIITPIGGVALLAGWLLMFMGLIRNVATRSPKP